MFGSKENKDILLSFINVVLERESRIEDLEINKEMVVIAKKESEE